MRNPQRTLIASALIMNMIADKGRTAHKRQLTVFELFSWFAVGVIFFFAGFVNSLISRSSSTRRMKASSERKIIKR